jgi:hypothetical protein
MEKKGTTPFNVSFQNVLYKSKNNITPDPINSIRNVSAQFDSIDAGRRYFDFRLQKNRSPAIDKGLNAGVLIDLDGNVRPRGVAPDIGCYEKQ